MRTIYIPRHFAGHRRGSCVPAVVTLLPQLRQGRDFVIEGFVVLANGKRDEHTWIEIEGITFDPTRRQYRKRHMGYEIVRRLPIDTYRKQWRETRSLWWDERVRSFGGRP